MFINFEELSHAMLVFNFFIEDDKLRHGEVSHEMLIPDLGIFMHFLTFGGLARMLVSKSLGMKQCFQTMFFSGFWCNRALVGAEK